MHNESGTLVSRKMAIDRGRVRMPPANFRLSPSFPPVWVKSIVFFHTKTDHCVCTVDMIAWEPAAKWR